MRAVLEDDPSYYYEGRFAVNAWKSNKERSSITVDYDVNPYKKDILGTDEEWIWDTFNFETGIIRYYKDLPVNGSLSITVVVDMMPVSPMITTSTTGMTVTFDGEVHNLSKGVNHVPALILPQGQNVLTFTGVGAVTIGLTGGRL